MIWKNLKKKLKPLIGMKAAGNTDPFVKRWQEFGAVMGMLAREARYLPKTGNEQGKVGELYTIWTHDRNIVNFKKWTFRKFGKGPFYSGEAFVKSLMKRGYTVLGEGEFATVLAKGDSDRVIKVIRRPDGWINYIHWAAQIGEAGQFAPKVFSYKKIKGKRRNFEVAVMERLSYTLDDAPKEHDMKLLPGLIWRAADNAMARKFTDLLAPGLMDYLAKMALKFEIPINDFDLHPGNLMLRKDGSFVVVDPVSRPRGEDVLRVKEGKFALRTSLLVLEICHIKIGLLIESSHRYRGRQSYAY